MLEIGDRVVFKKTGLPDRAMARTDSEVSWQEYFGGQLGVVDNIDMVNDEVRVRGRRHEDGADFTVWIDPKHLDVTLGALEVPRG